MKDLAIRVIEELLKTGLVSGPSEISERVPENSASLFTIQGWLRSEYKIVVDAKPSIDPKYNSRLWYTITLYEWSRSHEFWLDKSSSTMHYDTQEEALGYGLLRGLEILRLKL